MTLPSPADQVVDKGKMALDQWPLCRLIWHMRILNLVHSPKYLMKNELQMFASMSHCKVYLHLFNDAQTELHKFVYTLSQKLNGHAFDGLRGRKHAFG